MCVVVGGDNPRLLTRMRESFRVAPRRWVGCHGNHTAMSNDCDDIHRQLLMACSYFTAHHDCVHSKTLFASRRHWEKRRIKASGVLDADARTLGRTHSSQLCKPSVTGAKCNSPTNDDHLRSTCATKSLHRHLSDSERNVAYCVL